MRSLRGNTANAADVFASKRFADFVETAREKFDFVVIDTTNEIAGDGDIPHPAIGMAASPEAAMDMAESIGYPLVVSVPADRHRNRYAVIMDADMLEQDLLGTTLSEDAPMLIEQFL